MNRLCFESLVCALAVSVVTATGCAEEPSCTQAGCGPSIYDLGSEPWPAGDYEVVIAYELSGSVEATCALRIGAASESGDEDAGAFEPEPMADCSQTGGGAVSVRGSDHAVLEMFDSPARFELTVKRDGRVIFNETITPDYVSSEINGPGCGVCRNRNETIDVGALQ